MRDRTALVVPVPEAERIVGHWRAKHDPSASLGMPAHVTVLWPLGAYAAVRDGVAGLCAARHPFDFSFLQVATFDRDVVWLRPGPDDELRALIAAARATFPDWPPYKGAIDEPTPHLTVAEPSATMFDDVLSRVRADVEPHLPLPVHAASATLFGETDEGRYVELERFTFSATG